MDISYVFIPRTNQDASDEQRLCIAKLSPTDPMDVSGMRLEDLTALLLKLWSLDAETQLKAYKRFVRAVDVVPHTEAQQEDLFNAAAVPDNAFPLFATSQFMASLTKLGGMSAEEVESLGPPRAASSLGGFRRLRCAWRRLRHRKGKLPPPLSCLPCSLPAACSSC